MNRVITHYQNEIIIQKSRFIALLYPLDSKEDVKEILLKVKKQYPKATHYCYGYRVAGNGKSNDDGEPSNTAGRPILDTLIKNQLDYAIVIVVRYFGGIKLGAGGLTRAYVEATSKVLEQAELYHVETRENYRIICDYHYIDLLNNLLQKFNINIIDKQFSDRVIYQVTCRNNDLAECQSLMQGKLQIEELGQFEVLVKN